MRNQGELLAKLNDLERARTHWMHTHANCDGEKLNAKIEILRWVLDWKEETSDE